MDSIKSLLKQKLGRWYRKKYRLFKYHRPALPILSFLTVVLALGIWSLDTNLLFSAYTALFLFSASVYYYASYFLRFRTLVDTHHYNQSYLKIFSFRNIILFNICFVCCFALVGTVLDRIYVFRVGKELFSTAECAAFLPHNTVSPYQISYNGMLVYLLQVIVDGGLFGLLGALGLETCQIPTGLQLSNWLNGSYQFQSIDIFVTMFIYFTAVTVDVAFWVSILNEVLERLQVQGIEMLHIKSDVTGLFCRPQLDPYELTSLEQKRNTEILRRISLEEIDVIKFEQKLFYYLKNSRHVEVRDLFLRLMQESNNLSMFKEYVTYFQKSYDHRFEKVCKKIRIRNAAKASIIDDVDFRKIKKKKWKGRGERS